MKPTESGRETEADRTFHAKVLWSLKGTWEEISPNEYALFGRLAADEPLVSMNRRRRNRCIKNESSLCFTFDRLQQSQVAADPSRLNQLLNPRKPP